MRTNDVLLVGISTLLIFLSSSARSEWDGKGPVDAPKMKVGDSWVFKEWYSAPNVTDTWRRRVIYVAPNEDFVVEVTTDKGGDLRWPRWDKDHRHQYEDARLRLNFPLFVGKKWHESYLGRSVESGVEHYINKYKVAKVKNIKTKAGKFKAFEIRMTQLIVGGGRGTEKYWYAPDVKTIVKSKPSWRYGRELLSYELADDSQVAKTDSSKAEAYRVIFTTGLNERNIPVDDLAEFSIKDSIRLTVYVRWRFPFDRKESFLVRYRILDEGGKQVKTRGYEVKPSGDYYSTWYWFDLYTASGKPGRWMAEIEVDGTIVAKKYIDVVISGGSDSKELTTSILEPKTSTSGPWAPVGGDFTIGVKDEEPIIIYGHRGNSCNKAPTYKGTIKSVVAKKPKYGVLIDEGIGQRYSGRCQKVVPVRVLFYVPNKEKILDRAKKKNKSVVMDQVLFRDFDNSKARIYVSVK